MDGDVEAEGADGVAEDEGPSPSSQPIDEGGLVGAGPVGDLDAGWHDLAHGEGQWDVISETGGNWNYVRGRPGERRFGRRGLAGSFC